MLLRLAKENSGIRGKHRMAAGIVYKGHLVATGVNGYKSHPIMLNGDYREGQIFLHAETDAIVRATRVLTPKELAKSSLYVVRVLKDDSEALAKPCAGCMRVISEHGITHVEYTTGALDVD